MKHTILILITLAFIGCKKDEDPTIAKTTLDMQSNQLCVTKKFYTKTDTVVYPERCFEIDSLYFQRDNRIYITMTHDTTYATGIAFTYGVDSMSVGTYPNGNIVCYMQIPEEGVKLSGQQCRHGVLEVDDSGSSFSGSFTAWGYFNEGTVLQRDTLMYTVGRFNNVNY